MKKSNFNNLIVLNITKSLKCQQLQKKIIIIGIILSSTRHQTRAMSETSTVD